MKWRNWSVVCLLVVTVLAFTACTPKSGTTLKTDKTEYNAGELITVTYTAPGTFENNAWIGIIPSGIMHGNEAVNDQHDIAYKYLNKSTSGQITFNAPGAGTYDIRMHDTDNNGKEVASVTFTVKGGEGTQTATPTETATPATTTGNATLKLDKNQFNPGEAIVITYTAPGTFASNAWIGIIPSNIPHGSESQNDQHDVTYKYLNNATSGQMTFNAPATPGSYDFRLNDTDNNGVEVASVTFTVGGTTPAAATPQAAPASKYKVGDAVMVEWKGSWWPAQIIAVGSNNWKIHYDGYSSSWDEWVGPNRIKNR